MHMILLWKDLGTHQLSLSSPIFNDFSTVLYCRMLMAVVVIVQFGDGAKDVQEIKRFIRDRQLKCHRVVSCTLS